MVAAVISRNWLERRVRVAESVDVNNRGRVRRDPDEAPGASPEGRLPMYAETAIAPALSAIAPAASATLVMSYWVVIADHDAIRDAVLNQAVADLCPSCGS